VNVEVRIPEGLRREEWGVDSREFKVLKVLRRVYKQSGMRRRRRRGPEGEDDEEEADDGIGVGGYVIRFADGREHTVHFPYLFESLTLLSFVFYLLYFVYIHCVPWQLRCGSGINVSFLFRI